MTPTPHIGSMSSREMIDACKTHSLFSWSATSKVEPIPIARAEGQTRKWTVDGVEREAVVHLPAKTAVKSPLILAIHDQRVAYLKTEMSPGDHFKRLLLMRSGLTREQSTSRESARRCRRLAVG